MKLLLSAYACEPGKGSEAGVGWNCVLQAARFHDVWVLTRSTNRAAIESALEQQNLPNVSFIYRDLPRRARFWKKGTRGLYPYYYLWQVQALGHARELHREVGFDVCHHVTFVNYWMPSLLPLLPVPFVWGPVGGGESAPAGFQHTWSLRARLHERLRDAARGRSKLDPLVRICARRAALALATTRETGRRLEELGCRQVLVCSEAALSEGDIHRLGTFSSPPVRPFRLISIGRLLHWKGFALSLEAFREFQRSSALSEYWIIGDGPERASLARQAQRLGLERKVVFWGELPRHEALEKLAACHALVHPSLHDSGGWVCLEAMAAGRPVVCLDLGGPGLQVSSESGVKIAALTPHQTVAEMARAFRQLADSSTRCERVGAAGRQRVSRYYRWDIKGEFYRRVCYQAVKGTGKTPC